MVNKSFRSSNNLKEPTEGLLGVIPGQCIISAWTSLEQWGKSWEYSPSPGNWTRKLRVGVYWFHRTTRALTTSARWSIYLETNQSSCFVKLEARRFTFGIPPLAKDRSWNTFGCRDHSVKSRLRGFCLSIVYAWDGSGRNVQSKIWSKLLLLLQQNWIQKIWISSRMTHHCWIG